MVSIFICKIVNHLLYPIICVILFYICVNINHILKLSFCFCYYLHVFCVDLHSFLLCSCFSSHVWYKFFWAYLKIRDFFCLLLCGFYFCLPQFAPSDMGEKWKISPGKFYEKLVLRARFPFVTTIQSIQFPVWPNHPHLLLTLVVKPSVTWFLIGVGEVTCLATSNIIPQPIILTIAHRALAAFQICLLWLSITSDPILFCESSSTYIYDYGFLCQSNLICVHLSGSSHNLVH